MGSPPSQTWTRMALTLSMVGMQRQLLCLSPPLTGVSGKGPLHAGRPLQGYLPCLSVGACMICIPVLYDQAGLLKTQLCLTQALMFVQRAVCQQCLCCHLWSVVVACMAPAICAFCNTYIWGTWPGTMPGRVDILCTTADMDMLCTITDTFSLMRAARLVAEQMPSSADVVFDCIRICWLSIIVSILFLDASLSTALWIGLVAGLAYTL